MDSAIGSRRLREEVGRRRELEGELDDATSKIADLRRKLQYRDDEIEQVKLSLWQWQDAHGRVECLG